MGNNGQKAVILGLLKAACRGELRDEEEAWSAIELVLAGAADPHQADKDQKERLDQYIYALSLIYAHQTGAMPGFTNGENETRFERFVYAIPVPAGLRLTRNLVKAAIRRLDAKRNPRFAKDLRALKDISAAE